ncbi:hypothetical protein FB446DRAFT_795898 [Lentinula raphanica]|nr:hypothetical protein FB446DRAFT_795898 [Lentinula raphanica]
MDWVEKGSALENLSLINLARRCLRGEVVNVSSTFIGMIHELYFAAKINSLLIYAEQENPSHKGALAPILAHLCEEGISPFQASKWFASGSRWGRLAAAGTVYILMVIAKIEGTASRLRGRSVSEKVLTTLANEIRAPTQEISKQIVTSQLEPLLFQLQNKIPLIIPTLFSQQVRIRYGISAYLECTDISANDQYFDLFYQRTIMCLPRNVDIWKRWTQNGKDQATFLSLHPLSSSYLGGSSNVADAPEDTVEEEEVCEATTANSPYYQFALDLYKEDSLEIIQSTFDYNNATARERITKQKPFPIDKEKRSTWTGRQRNRASKAYRPSSLSQFAAAMTERFNGKGTLKKKQKWAYLSQEVISG